MSHTTGPWTVSQYLDNGEWGVLNNDNVIVVGVASRITEDDARLIAAAPDLLNALKAAIEVMEEDLDIILDSNCVLREYGPNLATLNEDAKPYVERLTVELAAARKAVDKAEGRP
jgi:hypothetical protein